MHSRIDPSRIMQYRHHPYPFGARFGQFVHTGSMLKSSLESFAVSLVSFSREMGSGGEHDLAAALSALNPSAERLDTSSDR